jgi:hypothetical protein
MTKPECTSVRIAAMAMARADGYQAEMLPDRVEMHLANCEDCRRELDQLRSLATLLNGQNRQQRIEHVWPRIEARLTGALEKEPTVRQPFILLGVLLLGYKLVEMIPDRDFDFLFKLVPILFIVAVFGYLRLNPFKINTELTLEDED